MQISSKERKSAEVAKKPILMGHPIDGTYGFLVEQSKISENLIKFSKCQDSLILVAKILETFLRIYTYFLLPPSEISKVKKIFFTFNEFFKNFSHFDPLLIAPPSANNTFFHLNITIFNLFLKKF
jgi:hypothetical protein